MIQVKEIKLPDIILPESGIGMVIMQPFIELCDCEPLCWQDNKKDKQMERIAKTLEIAKQANHGCSRTHFTIFPEYSIPGLEGVKKIHEIIQSDTWDKGTIVIGGIDGLTKDMYSALCNEGLTEVDKENSERNLRDNQWVNCCITWVKQTNGTVKRWVQLKLSPAWPERNITHSQMFAGHSLYIFSGNFENQTEYHFLSLVCFDWIGPINSNEGIWAVLSKIDNHWRASNTRKNINLIFVPQHNPKPNHRNFLENARNYFTRRTQYPFVNRNEGIIIFANSAGGLLPGKYKEYGFTSLVSSPVAPYDCKGCPPTFAVITKKLRGMDNLGGCKEALFRETGACIHSFKFSLPPFVNLDTPNRCFPIDEAIIYSVDDEIDDPRIPGESVPASVKWVNDRIEKIEPLLAHENEHPLKENIIDAHNKVSKEISRGSGDFLCRYITMASFGIEEEKDKWIKISGRNIHNVDGWNENEELNLETIIYSLSIMEIYESTIIKDSPTHATIKIKDKIIDIIVVSGKTHEECFEYAKSQYPGTGQRFIIAVTRNKLNSIWSKKSRSILQNIEISPEKGPDITDPDSNYYQCGYQNLVSSCINAKNIKELKTKVAEFIEI